MKQKNLLITVLGLLLAIILVRNIVSFMRVQDRLKEARTLIEKEKQEQSDLLKRREYIKSARFIESQARNKLGFAKSGELVVVLPNAEFLRSLVLPLPQDEALEDVPNWRKWVEVFGGE